MRSPSIPLRLPPALLSAAAAILSVAPLAAQSIVVTGPTDGAVQQALEYQATASGCAAQPGGWQWFTSDGQILGPANNDTIQAAWSTPGVKQVAAFHDACGGASGELQVTITSGGRARFGAGAFQVVEGAGTVSLSVLREGGADGAGSVRYTTISGSAVAGADFSAVSGTLQWGDGDGGNRLIPVPILDDDDFEGDETFQVRLFEPVGLTLTGTNPVAVTIDDDDPPSGDVLEFTELVYEVQESAAAALISLRRTGSGSGAVSVRFDTVAFDATPGTDYLETSTVVHWADGDLAQKTVEVPLVDDDEPEGEEIVDLELSEPTGGAVLGENDFAELVLIDGEAANGSLQFEESEVAVDEDAGTLVLAVSRSGGSSGAVSVGVTRLGGSASGQDFVFSPTTLSWADGDANLKTVSVELLDDDEAEGDETLVLVLGGATGGALIGSDDRVTITIVDDEVPVARARMATELVETAEGDGSVRLQIVRSGDLSVATSVTAVTVAATAVAGADFVALAQTLSWSAGDGSPRFVDVQLVDDGLQEPTEELAVELRAPEGLTLTAPFATTVRILDDDGDAAPSSVEFAAAGSQATESDGVALVRLRRLGATAAEASVEVFRREGTATPNTDFVFDPMRVTWPAGDGSDKLLSVELVPDSEPEPTESLLLALRDAVGADLGDLDVHRLDLLDDDRASPDARPLAEAPDAGPPVVLAEPGGPGRRVIWSEDGRLYEHFVGDDGVPVGPVAPITASAGRHVEPHAGRGSFLTWITRTPDLTASAVALGLFTGGNTPFVTATSGGPLELHAPRIAQAADRIHLLWLRAAQLETRSYRISLDGLAPLGPATELARGVERAELGVDAFGHAVAAWLDERGAVVYRRLGRDGLPSEPLVTVTDRLARSLALAVAPDGRVAVVWHTPQQAVVARFFDPEDGAEQAEPFVLLSDATDPVASGNRAGDLAVAAEDRATSGMRLALVPRGDTAAIERFLDAAGEPESPSAVALDDEDRWLLVSRGSIAAGGFGVLSRADRDRLRTACTPAADRLCQTGGRFSVVADWLEPGGESGRGRVGRLTDDTGYLWFFEPANIEVLVKTLDACSFSSHLWTFLTGLTNVGVDLRVDDSESGVTRSYANTLGSAMRPRFDTTAFEDCAPAARTGALHRAPYRAARRPARGSTGACLATENELCLADGRFAVSVEWETPSGDRGSGVARPLTADTGTFWFFEPENVELVLKVLDACSFADRFWVFAGGLTNVAVTLRVVDTATGLERVYESPLGRDFLPILDTDAFDTCSAP